MSDRNLTELWRPVVGYEGRYEVSNLGRVKSIARFVVMGAAGNSLLRERILSQAPDSSGHMMVNLCKQGDQRTRLVHQLVLEAFVGPKSSGMEARHCPDSNKKNNRLDNLCWGTHAENMADIAVAGKHKGLKLSVNQVRRLRAMRRLGIPYANLGPMFGVSPSQAHRIVTGKRRSHIT